MQFQVQPGTLSDLINRLQMQNGFFFSGRICSIRPLKFCFVRILFKWKKPILLPFSVMEIVINWRIIRSLHLLIGCSGEVIWIFQARGVNVESLCSLLICAIAPALCFVGTAGSHWHCHVPNGVAGVSHNREWIPGSHLHHLGSQQALLPHTAPRAQGSHLSTLHQWINGERQIHPPGCPGNSSKSGKSLNQLGSPVNLAEPV